MSDQPAESPGYANWLYERQCRRKRAYSARSASNAVLEMRRKYPGEVFEFYQCRFCGRYHVGHPGSRPHG